MRGIFLFLSLSMFSLFVNAKVEPKKPVVKAPAPAPTVAKKPVSKINYATTFPKQDVCFLLTKMDTGEIVEQNDTKRCVERLSPCSTFKVAAALMAFEEKIFKSEKDVIKWDKIKRDRPELNMDMNVHQWMKRSALWVTQRITPQIGEKKIKQYLDVFSYGNQDFSGGLGSAWISSSLKISAHEQVHFFKAIWGNKLPVSKQTVDLTKKIIFVKDLNPNFKVFGKTGSGCLDKDCDKPGKKGRMLGWFVGVIEGKNESYTFAVNAVDLVPNPEYAGPRVRESTFAALKQTGLFK